MVSIIHAETTSSQPPSQTLHVPRPKLPSRHPTPPIHSPRTPHAHRKPARFLLHDELLAGYMLREDRHSSGKISIKDRVMGKFTVVVVAGRGRKAGAKLLFERSERDGKERRTERRYSQAGFGKLVFRGQEEGKQMWDARYSGVFFLFFKSETHRCGRHSWYGARTIEEPHLGRMSFFFHNLTDGFIPFVIEEPSIQRLIWRQTRSW